MADEQLDAAGRNLKLEAEQRDADLTTVMETPAGRRFIYRLLANAKLDEHSYAGELTHGTAYNEGVRDMAVKLNRELKRVCRKLWLLMHEEHDPANLVYRGGDASKREATSG